MSARQPRIPGPDHPITITPHQGRILVRVAVKAAHDLGLQVGWQSHEAA